MTHKRYIVVLNEYILNAITLLFSAPLMLTEGTTVLNGLL